MIVLQIRLEGEKFQTVQIIQFLIWVLIAVWNFLSLKVQELST